MPVFGKKGKKEKTAPKAAAKGVAAKQPKQKQPKQSKPSVPADIYTLFLGLSALFLITAAVLLGLNYYWYQTTDPAVLPMNTWLG